MSGLIGAATLLWLARHRPAKLVPGDLLLIFFVWYGATRFLLEFMRSGNWTFFGIPTAQILTLGFILVGIVGLWYRHGPGRPQPTETDETTDGDELDDVDGDDIDDEVDVDDQGHAAAPGPDDRPTTELGAPPA